MNKVAIIIVNWNTGQYLADCIRSLAALPEREIERIDEVVVVDNASSDRSVIKAKQVVGENINKPRVRFVQNEKNEGFAAANNVGIDRVLQKEKMTHVLLLNPDTKVRPGMVIEMIEVLGKNERAGVVGAKLIGADGKLQPSIRHFPTKKEMFLYLLKLGRFVRQEKTDYDKEQKVDQVMGAAFLIRKEVVESVGKLDDGFFLWFEEVDYCRRVVNEGWEVWYTPSAVCEHLGGISFGQLVGFQKTVPWLKSMQRYARKHMGYGTVAALYVLSPVSLLLSIPATLMHLVNRR
jgi:GT2 family glycosyltransferase